MRKRLAGSYCGSDRGYSLDPGKLIAYKNRKTNNFRKTKKSRVATVYLSTTSGFQPKVTINTGKETGKVTPIGGGQGGAEAGKQSLETDSKWTWMLNILTDFQNIKNNINMFKELQEYVFKKVKENILSESEQIETEHRTKKKFKIK